MGKPSPPEPPDPTKTAAAQTASNVETANASARLAATNSYSPYGSVTYNPVGYEDIGGNKVPQYQQVTTLSPEQQDIYNRTTGIERQALDTGARGLSGASDILGSPISFDGLPALPGVNDFSADRQRVENAQLARFNQDFPALQEDVISRLNAEGLQRGSEAYDTAMKGLERQQVDAANQAILSSGQEQSRLFGLAGQSRQQALAELLQQRNQPINELTALLGTSQVQNPQAAPNFGVQVQPTNVLGAYGLQQQALLNNYNQRMGANNALWGGLSNLGSAAFAFGGL